MHNTIKNVLQLQYQNISLLKKLKYLATHDPLTNLDNSRLFYDNLSTAMKRAKSKKYFIALLYIDLDKFKYVNDHYGHSMGDKVLKYATTVIREQLTHKDFLARLGGDEFAVILENINDEDSIIEMAKNICTNIEKPFVIDDVTIHISASIGISIYPVHGKDIDQLLKAADQAMYHVKKNGNNNFSFSRKKIMS
ncbi:MAG: GGDEF domain-containing protein [Gammaproteobacteria bacterium]|nr:GGDEF domain-containing protein [Gammaproteobacteria bacterium]